MKKFPAVLVGGIAAMLLTVVLFFTILGNAILSAIHFITLIAILVAEGVTVGYLYFAKGSPRRLAAAMVSVIMIPFSVILSVVYIVAFPEGYGTYFGWYCAGTLVVNLICYILVHFDGKKSDENDSLQAAKNNMLNLRKLVKCIQADPAAKAYDDRLRKLEEKLHFSNDCVISTVDEDIRNMLLQLQANIADPEYDAQQQLAQIEKMVDTRKIML